MFYRLLSVTCCGL